MALAEQIDIITEFTQRLQVAVIGAEETTDKHEKWVEGTETETIPTANGPLKTLRGQIAEWRLSSDSSVQQVIDSYSLTFEQKMDQFDDDFVNYLLTIGFEPAVLYGPGILLDRRAQTVAFNGVTYYWGGTLPYTTTGDFGTEPSWLIAPIIGGIEVPQMSFASGGNIVRKTQSVLGADGEWYYWTGIFPKLIAPGSTVESAGGVGQNKFKLSSGVVPLRPLMKIVASSAGLVLNPGSFEYGATISSEADALPHFGTGKLWRWGGVLPKVVDVGSEPLSSGGVGPSQWIEVSTAGGTNAGITISEIPPTGVALGHRWYCTSDGRTYIRYLDSDSVQWVEESPQGSVFDGLEPRINESLRRSYDEAGYNVVGTFLEGFTIVNANDVGIDETTGKGFTGPAGTVAAGTDPASGGFFDVSFVLSPSTPKVNVAAYGFSESASSYENSIALQKAATAANATGGCIVEFPEGTFNVGYQDFAGAAGLGYSYRGGQYFRLKDLTRPVLLKFNNTKIKFGEGQRVGSFDPVTGAAMPTIQTNMNYRAFRGILFGSERCKYVGATGQLAIDFMGETVILGGEFGDAGYQCPEYGFWFIDHRQLASNLNYIATNGAMDAIYLAGLVGSDCFSEVSGLNVERMGRSGVVVAGGSNIRINGRSDKCGLGSIASAPGHNFAIESEVRRVDNVEFNITSGDALSCSFSIYSTGPRMVRNIKVLGGVLENTVGYACKSNTPELKYIGTTIRGVIAEHRNEFFDSDRDSFAAEMIDCSHYDYNQLHVQTPFKNGTHFDRNKFIRLKLSNYKLFSEGLTLARFTLGKLSEPIVDGFKATIIGDITGVATTGQRVLALENPVELVDFEIINRTSGEGGPDLRAYVEVIGVDECRVRNARISGIGQATSTILWLSAYISAGGRSGYLTDGDPLSKQPAFRFLPLAVNGHFSRAQSTSGYGRVFLVSDQPTTGDWVWIVGDTLLRSAPTTGQIWGWKCTVAGKAGSGAVFKAMGTLA